MLEYTEKKMLNQQGTLIKDSSETIRMEDLNKNINKAFINWFIGFIEGNENVFIVNRRYLRFEINCNIKNERIIYYIKKNLGFGNIRKLRFLDTIIIEFSVQENVSDLLKLIYLLNGNFRCKSKQNNFKIWYKKLYVKLKKKDLLFLLPEYREEIKDVNLLNSWLLGYIDSRCLFYARWHKSKKLKEGKELYLCCIFWNLNKELLLKIKEVLNSKSIIEEKTKWNLPFNKLLIENINEKNKLIEYLKKYKLKTNKIKKYKYWKILLNLETIYKDTGNQNIEIIDKYLIKFKSISSEDELSKL